MLLTQRQVRGGGGGVVGGFAGDAVFNSRASSFEILFSAILGEG